MDFGWFNWTLTGAAIIGILGLSLYCRRYIRDVADFLSAGRVAGRYVICVGSMEEALGIIALVQMMERNYLCGFAIAFWNITTVALNMVINLSGWCTYRFRETRAMSFGQFLEIRYNRAIRIVASVIRATADILTEILLPSLAARFFIYFFDLPFSFRILGFEISTYVVIMLFTLSIAIFIICSGGSVALLVADCVQGLLCYPLFFAIVAFALYKFSWNNEIAPTLLDRVPGESFLNPFDVYNLRNFNIFMVFIGLFSNIMNRAIWLGSGFSTSAKSAHEQKMAGVLGIWRGGFSSLMLTMLGVMMIVMMNHRDFSAIARETRTKLSLKVSSEVMPPELRAEFDAGITVIPEQKQHIGVDPRLSQKRNLDTPYLNAAEAALEHTGNGKHKFQQFRTFYSQLMFPVAMRHLLPKWLLGMLMLLAVMLMISTDCSRIFMIAAGIAQDLVLPFLKKPMETKHQLYMIRIFAMLVAVIFFFGSLFMTQVDYIQLFITSVGALWTGGAGALAVFGLYSRFGNTAGAAASLIGGSGFSLVSWLVAHNWANHVYPWLEQRGWIPAVSRFLEVASSPFHPFVVWEMDAARFPINAYERLFIALLLSIICYVAASLLFKSKPFNLEKMLHRGEYADDKTRVITSKWTLRNIFSKLIGITPEYSKADRIIARSVFTYTFIYRFVICFVIVLILNKISPWQPKAWSTYYLITLIIVPSIIGCISTFWFSIGGIIDLKNMFHDLAARKRDFSDDGRVDKKE